MYKIFLVEDEIVIRESIRDSIPWEKTEFIFIGEAPDGEIALPLIQKMKPDILITDVKMPFMDGLELSSFVRKTMPDVKIIMISGHQEFSLAKQAISIGIEEYVLKPVNSEELLMVLRKVVKIIEKEKNNLEKLESANQYMIENSELVKQKILNEILMETIPPHLAADQLKSMGIDLYSDYYAVMNVICKINLHWDPEINTQISLIIENLTCNKNHVIKISKSLRETVLLIKGDDSIILEKECYDLKESILEESNKLGLSNIFIGIGNIKNRIREISSAYAEVSNFGESEIVAHPDEVIMHQELTKMNVDQLRYSNFEDLEILNALRYQNKQGIIDLLQQYFDKIKDSEISNIWSIYLAVRINIIFSEYLTELGENASNIVPKQTCIEEEAINFDTKEKLQKYMEDVCLCGLEFRNQKKSNYFEIIEDAKKYIDINYSDPDISLNEVAKHLHISACYFSSIFSRETGITFMHYLTNRRMEKAKILLKSSSLKSGAIGQLVGYKDAHYFSYFFKKNIGVNPSEYKK